MSLIINIPDRAHSTQNITLGGLDYQMTLTFNDRDQRWSLGLSRNSLPIVSGVRIMENQALLYRYNLSAFSHGDLFVVRDKVDNKNVGRDNFGANSSYVLLYMTNEEIAELQ